MSGRGIGADRYRERNRADRRERDWADRRERDREDQREGERGGSAEE